MAEEVLLIAGLVALSSSVVLILATIALHLFVPRRLERELVTARYFNELELGLAFPASIFRSLAITRAIALPSSMRKRFGDYDLRARVSPSFVWGCRVYMLLAGCTGVAITVMVGTTALLMLRGRI